MSLSPTLFKPINFKRQIFTDCIRDNFVTHFLDPTVSITVHERAHHGYRVEQVVKLSHIWHVDNYSWGIWKDIYADMLCPYRRFIHQDSQH